MVQGEDPEPLRERGEHLAVAIPRRHLGRKQHQSRPAARADDVVQRHVARVEPPLLEYRARSSLTSPAPSSPDAKAPVPVPACGPCAPNRQPRVFLFKGRIQLGMRDVFSRVPATISRRTPRDASGSRPVSLPKPRGRRIAGEAAVTPPTAVRRRGGRKVGRAFPRRSCGRLSGSSTHGKRATRADLRFHRLRREPARLLALRGRGAGRGQAGPAGFR